jgi:hypothetical protein
MGGANLRWARAGAAPVRGCGIRRSVQVIVMGGRSGDCNLSVPWQDDHVA